MNPLLAGLLSNQQNSGCALAKFARGTPPRQQETNTKPTSKSDTWTKRAEPDAKRAPTLTGTYKSDTNLLNPDVVTVSVSVPETAPPQNGS